MAEGSNEKLVSIEVVNPASRLKPETHGRMVNMNKIKLAHAKVR
jgi:hypothetical protein